MQTCTEIADEMRSFVRTEAEATRRAFEETWSLPVLERVEQGRCLHNLLWHDGKTERYVGLQSSSGNDSDFREGDFICVSRGDARSPLLTGQLYRVEDDRVWIDAPRLSEEKRRELQTGSWVMDRSYLDLESFYRKAVDDLAQTVRGRERILPLLSGELIPEVDLQTLDEASGETEKEGVNESQAEAIAQAVATDLCHLVQGPPGTGKTFVLAHVVKQRLARGERILVTAATHRAIHNALGMISRFIDDADQIAKIGPDIYDPDLGVAQYQNFSESPLAHSDGGYVIGATPFAARSKRLRGVDFDTVIIDEAGQLTLPLAVMAMLAADTYIFIGDHRQLPPVVLSLPANEAHHASAFSRLSEQGFSTMLEITYRMNAELVRWPANNFYSGKLKAARRNAERRLALPRVPEQFSEALDPATPLVMIEMEHQNARRKSDEEASLVANLLEELVRLGFSLSDVAVIVPFRRQARRVRYFLRAKKAILEEHLRDVVIDTVERMQGQERELVLISMTASEPEYVERMLGFLLQPQRLNVAVTRSRSKTIIIASEQIAIADPIDSDHHEQVELWKSLRNAAHVVRI